MSEQPKTNWIVITDEDSLPKMSTWFVVLQPDSYRSDVPPYLIGQYWGQSLEEFKPWKRYLPIPYIYLCGKCEGVVNRDKDEGQFDIHSGWLCDDCELDQGIINPA